MASQNNDMAAVLKEIKEYCNKWLAASGMSEEDFLSYRTCRHFRVLLQEREDGFAVQLSQGKEQEPIGLPFFVGFKNNILEMEQYFENTPLILMYLAGQLDKANKENPINGSYGPEFFKERVRKACPRILEKGRVLMSVE